MLEQQETALGVFLYIEMAFNVSYESTCGGLVKHRVDHTIVQWIRAMLEGQLLVVTLNGFSTRVAVSRVCPQGGVLSPIL